MALNSTSTIKIVDLLCEGPIEGIVGNREGVFLDETALESGNQVNVSRDLVSVKSRVGGRGQSQLPQVNNQAQNVVEVSKEVGSNYSETLNSNNQVKTRDYGAGTVVHQVTDPDLDSLDLIFTVPRLFSTAAEGLAKGQLFDATIVFDVAIQGGGRGSFKKIEVEDARITDTVEGFKKDQFILSGISTSNYQFSIKGIKLSTFGEAPWNVRVRKYPSNIYQNPLPHTKNKRINTTAQNIDKQVFEASYKTFIDEDKRTPLANGRGNQLVWSSVVERQHFRTAYPFSAVVGLNISTEQFNSLPTRAYKVRGRKIQIPSNATPRDDGSLNFAGDFDGTLKEELVYTTCPVCIFYDLMTNDRYGAGHFVDAANLSWIDLYPLARYSNEQIDGEPRFACNTVISSQVEAFTILQDFASIFRGVMYWQSNVIQLTADHGNLDGSDVSPVHLFSNSSVVGGAFTYSGSSLKTRSTSVRIRYSDPDNFYRPNVVVVEDSVLIDKFGYQVKEITAFACTSKKQAQRMGRWMMKSEELDQSTVNFAVGLEGAVVFPGQVFAISDEVRAGTRLSGRVSSSTINSIVSDQAITLPAGDNPKLTCVLADGTVEIKNIDVDQTSGTTVSLVENFSSAPLAQAVYSIATDSVSNQKFRCISVGDNGDGTYGVVGVEHNDSIYASVDDNVELEFDDITLLNDPPPIPII